jgi:hypothetical protein
MASNGTSATTLSTLSFNDSFRVSTASDDENDRAQLATIRLVALRVLYVLIGGLGTVGNLMLAVTLLFFASVSQKVSIVLIRFSFIQRFFVFVFVSLMTRNISCAL